MHCCLDSIQTATQALSGSHDVYCRLNQSQHSRGHLDDGGSCKGQADHDEAKFANAAVSPIVGEGAVRHLLLKGCAVPCCRSSQSYFYYFMFTVEEMSTQ